MKIVFFDDNQNSKELETEAQDLKQIFKIADNLSDIELDKIKLTIDQFPQVKEK